MFEQTSATKLSRKYWRKHSWLITGLLVAVGLVAGVNEARLWAAHIYPEKSTAQVFESLGQLAIAGDKPLEQEARGEINLLLMGVGGEGEYGSITPDTIIVLSYRPITASSEAKLALVSIPRDLAISIPGDGRLHKFNDSYRYAEWSRAGAGPAATMKAVEDWTGILIDYYVTIDTAVLRSAVDLVGGVEVVVENSFFDPYYPDGNNGYLHDVKFEAGPQHLDGERALQFVRSRHGNNGEASDFARSRRQDKILVTLKDKVTGGNLISNSAAILQLMDSLAGHFHTSLEPWQLKRVYDLVKAVPTEVVQRNFLDPKTGLVCSKIAEDTGWYLLVSCEGKTKDNVHTWASHRFE